MERDRALIQPRDASRQTPRPLRVGRYSALVLGIP